jgi:hypothetical protein
VSEHETKDQFLEFGYPATGAILDRAQHAFRVPVFSLGRS